MATKTDLTPEQQIEALKAELGRTQTEHAQAIEESRAKDAIIEGQEAALKAANAQGASALSVVTHEGKNYQVLAGRFSLEDKVITHAELKANPELVKRVVEEFPDLLQELPEVKA